MIKILYSLYLTKRVVFHGIIALIMLFFFSLCHHSLYGVGFFPSVFVEVDYTDPLLYIEMEAEKYLKNQKSELECLCDFIEFESKTEKEE